MGVSRRALLALAAAPAGAARAQDFPSRPVTVIAAGAAGGPTDTITRIVADSMGRHLGQQALHMGARMDEAALAGALRRRPAGVEAVGGGDGQQPHVSPVLAEQPHGLYGFRRYGALVSHDDLRVRPRRAHPISTVDNLFG